MHNVDSSPSVVVKDVHNGDSLLGVVPHPTQGRLFPHNSDNAEN